MKADANDLNVTLNVAHMKAYRLANMARLLCYAAAGAEAGNDSRISADQFAADATEVLKDLEERAYEIAGIIEHVPAFRILPEVRFSAPLPNNATAIKEAAE